MIGILAVFVVFISIGLIHLIIAIPILSAPQIFSMGCKVAILAADLIWEGALRVIANNDTSQILVFEGMMKSDSVTLVVLFLGQPY